MTGLLRKVGRVARQIRGNPKRSLRRYICRNLPRMLTYSDIRTVEGVVEALPPLQVVFDEPFVYRPTTEDHDLLRRNRYFTGRPVILPPVALYDIPDGLIFPQSGLIADKGAGSCWNRPSFSVS